MPRWEIAGRALIAGCVTGGLLGALLGALSGIGEHGTIVTAVGYAVAGAVYGVPVGVVLCLPGMIVATVLYPLLAERHDHADARAGVAVAVGLATAICLVPTAAAPFMIVVVPVAVIATLLGLRFGNGGRNGSGRAPVRRVPPGWRREPRRGSLGRCAGSRFSWWP
ncbi:hypothetical protein JL108_06445 [Aeromicrobium sp. YIM 150415]|uniref:hypothetical protein n=1 Tax=Aeromicrobium sp. YIM 150415 TaxID=2803912 RepID=UPI0019657574|nr:hypothetical protein [Aeromicrobium sp. YIM 150415]MBM9463083.1 hypothetical protein [Aeromicrobium sp. YIM 150415]